MMAYVSLSMEQIDVIRSEVCNSEKFSLPSDNNQIETYQCLQYFTSGSLNLYFGNWNKIVLFFPLTPLFQFVIFPQNRNQTTALSIFTTSATHTFGFCQQSFLKWMSLT